MKLASIILPHAGNNSADLFMVHQLLKHELLKTWGGYTSYETIGAWRGADEFEIVGEKAIKYEIAMDRADTPKFRTLALFIGYKAQQEAVMIVTANGDVEFLHPAKEGLTDTPTAA